MGSGIVRFCQRSQEMTSLIKPHLPGARKLAECMYYHWAHKHKPTDEYIQSCPHGLNAQARTHIYFTLCFFFFSQ